MSLTILVEQLFIWLIKMVTQKQIHAIENLFWNDIDMNEINMI